MALTREEVRRVAALARLELTAEEEERLARQLGDVVDYIDQLARFETAPIGEVDPSTPAVADDPAPGLPLAAVLANAPRSLDPFILVPRALEGDA